MRIEIKRFQDKATAFETYNDNGKEHGPQEFHSANGRKLSYYSINGLTHGFVKNTEPNGDVWGLAKHFGKLIHDGILSNAQKLKELKEHKSKDKKARKKVLKAVLKARKNGNKEKARKIISEFHTEKSEIPRLTAVKIWPFTNKKTGKHEELASVTVSSYFYDKKSHKKCPNVWSRMGRSSGSLSVAEAKFIKKVDRAQRVKINKKMQKALTKGNRKKAKDIAQKFHTKNPNVPRFTALKFEQKQRG